MVGIFLANTDNEWFDFLASAPDVDEVNFWKPSPTGFAAIEEGELFAFRLKSPRGKVGGFGVLSSSSVLPIQLAWEAFGIKNGVGSLGGMVRSIARYKEKEVITASSFIGCRVLVQPVFLPEYLWFDVPSSWSKNIVGGKRFSTDDAEGRYLWDALQDRATAWSAPTSPERAFAEGAVARYGEPILIAPRLGQGAFRIAVTESYKRQCALTGGKVLPALDAAHIRPFSEGGAHRRSNGILLRKDIHSVFDAGYATIDETLRFVVSPKVKDVFDNGNEYRRLHGVRLRPPNRAEDRPEPEALRWHNTNRFLG
jgi:putative restriction endonuclease